MKDFTNIYIVLDESGSMYGLKEQTLEGLNTFIRQQKDLGDNADLTLVTFNNQIMTRINHMPIKEINLLGHNDYNPNYSTALLDAIGETIDKAKYHRDWSYFKDTPDKGILVIITDGQENCSTKFTRKAIFGKIAEVQKELKWEVIFLAANQDAIHEAAGFGIMADRAQNFSNTDIGVKAMYANLSKGTTSYRTTGSVEIGRAHV